MWAFFIFDVGFSEERFFDLTFEQVIQIRKRQKERFRENLIGSAMIASTMVNMHLKPHERTTIDTFLPELEDEKREPISADMLIALFAANGSEIIINDSAGTDGGS